MNIVENLNDKQKEAVLTTEGPLLILAGAGSGKTKTLTHRVAHLIYDKKVPAGSVMAVTFTNKASQEMRERIASILNQPSMTQFSPQFFHPRIPVIGTFHSICSKILRKEIEVLGRDRNFHIVDTSEQLAIIKKIVKRIGLDPKQFAPRSFLSSISSLKNKMMSPESFLASTQGYVEEITAKVYGQYEKTLIENEVLDFDDLLLLVVKIFREYPGILEKYQRQFRYILVDEYQDTNTIQYQFISMLSAKHRNLCVVGDDWQSIYAFRGADIRNILEFEKDYPDAKVVHLEQNYRSTQNILDAAHGIISQNAQKKDKKLWTQEKEGDPIFVYESEDETGEARYVAENIEKLCKEKSVLYKDCAVLYRTNAQSRALEEAFLDYDIPYRIVGGVKFYERKEIKDIIAYLRFLNCPSDRIALERIANEPKRSIGVKTLASWLEYAYKKECNPLEAGFSLENAQLSASKKKTVQTFCESIKRIQEKKDEMNLSEWTEYVYRESGYEAMLISSNSPENEARRENVGELIGSLKRYNEADIEEALNLFLEEVALISDSDELNGKEESVHCMTLHSAKGLEFDYIFVVGMEENILPHSRSALSIAELEEERRLMYVGITRAKKVAHLIYARHRMLFGTIQANPPSRFLEEIPKKLMEKKDQETCFEGNEYVNGNPFGKQKFLLRKKSKEQYVSQSRSDGERIRHKTFGEGVIVSQDKSLYCIVFQKHGIKKIAKDADVFE
jgi:DNA helicase-2/ATP-dependent DNA helicase PcrA